jgi:large subunit ribosomal protein L23
MGLFGKKKVADDTATPAPVKEKKVLAPVAVESVTSVILRPRITEKAALLAERNVYAFEIKKGATKYDVRDAVKALYKVTPVSVRIVNKQPRHFMSASRGRDMMENGLRKAYVYLKKGDRIELV